MYKVKFKKSALKRSDCNLLRSQNEVQDAQNADKADIPDSFRTEIISEREGSIY